MIIAGKYSFNKGEEYISAKYPHLLSEIVQVISAIDATAHIGKYSFMVYNVCAKMTIFRNLGHIDAGVEIVPIKQFAEEMSSDVSYFEQFI